MIDKTTPVGARVRVVRCNPEWPKKLRLNVGDEHVISRMIETVGGDVSVRLRGFDHDSRLSWRGRRGFFNFPRSSFVLVDGEGS